MFNLIIQAILKYAFNHPDINPKTIYTHGRSLGGTILK